MEVNTALRNLRNKKACGPDDIAEELLKSLPTQAVKLLHETHEDIRKDPSQTPEEWKISKIFLLHKGGEQSRCSNYRPISITSVIYKIFTQILTERLTHFVEDNNLLRDAQGGFRKKRSTMDS